jgi:hypothetical protein
VSDEEALACSSHRVLKETVTPPPPPAPPSPSERHPSDEQALPSSRHHPSNQVLRESYAAEVGVDAEGGGEGEVGGGGHALGGREGLAAGAARPKMLAVDLDCGLDGLPHICALWDLSLARVAAHDKGSVWLATKAQVAICV